MDFGNAPRVTPLTSANAPLRADIVTARDSVAVELPPERTVQSADAGEAVKLDIQARGDDRRTQDRAIQANQAEIQRQARGSAVESRIVIEPITRSIVLQKRDPKTGETTEQLPDETTLKLRLYNRQAADRARAASEAARSIERTA
jgi:hypothetical protein